MVSYYIVFYKLLNRDIIFSYKFINENGSENKIVYYDSFISLINALYNGDIDFIFF